MSLKSHLKRSFSHSKCRFNFFNYINNLTDFCQVIFLQKWFAQTEILVTFRPAKAGMAELVDAPDLGSGVLGRAGSIPVPGISLR